MEDITISPKVASLLGHRIIRTDTSGDFTSGLDFVRSVMRTTVDAYWGIIRKVTVYVPCELLRCGGRITYASVTEDADITRTAYLRSQLDEASAAVLVLSLAPMGNALRSLLEKSTFLQVVQEDPTKQLVVVVPGDKFVKYSDKEWRHEWEKRHKEEKLDALRKSLIKCSRAQDKRSSVSIFMENSERFKFFHFYR
jgi:hypothetical protein